MAIEFSQICYWSLSGITENTHEKILAVTKIACVVIPHSWQTHKKAAASTYIIQPFVQRYPMVLYQMSWTPMKNA